LMRFSEFAFPPFQVTLICIQKSATASMIRMLRVVDLWCPLVNIYPCLLPPGDQSIGRYAQRFCLQTKSIY
jgi:hypothetical protein